MSRDQSTQLQRLLDLLRQGDEAAARELVGRAYERLRLLAQCILHRDFPRFDGRHGTASILNATALRLLESLEEFRPVTCRDFFNFAAVHIRRELLGIARRVKRDDEVVGLPEGGPGEPAGSTDDPVELAVWAEFHERVGQLTEVEREVMHLHWYDGLTQAETAGVLGISPRMV